MLDKWVDGLGADYHNTVWRAVIDTEARAVFRRDQNYTNILGVADFFGRRYLELIDNHSILGLLTESEAADRVGGAITYDFRGRQLSPNTVRYAKVLQDFTRIFPNFGSFESIAEIGVGYGGQARLVSEHARMHATKLRTYELIDLLPVCLLAQSYLDNFRMHPCCHYRTKSQIPRDGHWDFVTSNYAFSEFDADLEREYLDLVILRSKSGYLTMNSGLSNSGQWTQPVLPVETLLAELPNAVLLSEDPVVYPSNYILVFGDHSAGHGVPLAEMRANEQRSIEHFRHVAEVNEAMRKAGEAKGAVVRDWVIARIKALLLLLKCVSGGLPVSRSWRRHLVYQRSRYNFCEPVLFRHLRSGYEATLLVCDPDAAE